MSLTIVMPGKEANQESVYTVLPFMEDYNVQADQVTGAGERGVGREGRGDRGGLRALRG